MATPGLPDWKDRIAQNLGINLTPAVSTFFDAWARAEGGNAANNPFNTTQHAPGASAYNSVGVRNYQTPDQGIMATVQTLQNGNYGNIIAALKAGKDPVAMAQALANSPWGTGALVLKVLGAAPQNEAPPSTPTKPTAPGMTDLTAGIQNVSQFPQQNLGPVQSPLQTLLQNAAPSAGSVKTLSSLGGLAAKTAQAAQAPITVPMLPKLGGPITIPNSDGGAVTLRGATKKDTAAVLAVKSYLGTPYVWGGSQPGGFDCSGLLQYVWGKQGVQIPRTTYAQFQAGQSVPKDKLLPGDAVFFKGSDSKNGLPGHVGMYVGNGKFIEAPHTGANVRVSTLAGRSDYQGARRYA